MTHESDCYQGLALSILLRDERRYGIVPLYRRRNTCEDCLAYKLPKRTNHLHRYDEVEVGYASKKQVTALQRKALRREQGYFAMSFVDEADVLVVAEPGLIYGVMQTVEAMQADLVSIAQARTYNRLRFNDQWRPLEPDPENTIIPSKCKDIVDFEKQLRKINIAYGRNLSGLPPEEISSKFNSWWDPTGVDDVWTQGV